MDVVVVISSVLLVTAACLAAIRVVLGPSVLDRVVALDMMLAIIVCSLAVLAVSIRDSTIVSVLVVVSLLGFVGSVSIVRVLNQEQSDQ